MQDQWRQRIERRHHFDPAIQEERAWHQRTGTRQFELSTGSQADKKRKKYFFEAYSKKYVICNRKCKAPKLEKILPNSNVDADSIVHSSYSIAKHKTPVSKLPWRYLDAAVPLRSFPELQNTIAPMHNSIGNLLRGDSEATVSRHKGTVHLQNTLAREL